MADKTIPERLAEVRALNAEIEASAPVSNITPMPTPDAAPEPVAVPPASASVAIKGTWAEQEARHAAALAHSIAHRDNAPVVVEGAPIVASTEPQKTVISYPEVK